MPWHEVSLSALSALSLSLNSPARHRAHVPPFQNGHPGGSVTALPRRCPQLAVVAPPPAVDAPLAIDAGGVGGAQGQGGPPAHAGRVDGQAGRVAAGAEGAGA